MLVERVQCQVFPIRRKRKLLKVDHGFEAANHRAVAGVPVELIERGACCGAIDQHSVLRRAEFGSAQISRGSRNVAGQQQRVTAPSQSFPVHALREKRLASGEQQVVGHRYSTTLAC